MSHPRAGASFSSPSDITIAGKWLSARRPVPGAGRHTANYQTQSQSTLISSPAPVCSSAVKRSIGFTTGFYNHGESPYWLKAATTALTFKTLLRQYAKQELTHSK